ncbi:MFS transporter [Skermanella stibiiresistens]|nr:MFS transporter [Skermanella stibiiresistens]
MPAREEDTKPADGTVAVSRLPASLAPFRYPMFRAIWFATLASNLGVWIQSVGAAWLMTTISDSAAMVALVQSATAMPVLMFSLFGGALADLWDRRLVFLIGQIIVLSGATLIAVMEGVGAVTPWLLLALVFVLDSGSALRQPAYQASVGDLVPRSELPTAVALNSIGFNIARSVGPAIGGLVVASLGVQASFILNAVSNVFIIGVLLMWRPKPQGDELPREGLLPAMVSGLRYVGGSPTIMTVMLRCFVFTGLAGAVWALLPLVARQDMGGGPFTYGVLLGSLGIGAILGALNIGTLRRRTSGQLLVAIGTTAFAAATLLVGLFPSLYVVVPALVLGGAAWMTTLSSFNVMVQLSAANWVKARVLSIYQMSLFGGLALGSWGWGHAAETIGTGKALILSGVGLALSMVLALRFRLPANIAPDLSPIVAIPRPTLAPGVDAGPGSVAVTVEYEVDPADAPAFSGAMRSLRRLRKRDGAVRWTLYQDAANPRRWVEAFLLKSWLDDLRHQRRATMADQETLQLVRAFHRGAAEPRVSHLLARGTPRMGWPPGVDAEH